VSRWAVVLAGGVGSRFWPLSTPSRPKQLLPLATDKPLLRDSFDRLTPIVPAKQILVLTNTALGGALAELLPELPAANLMFEPQPAGTAAALTWAALEIARRDGDDATMLCIHADWSITDDEQFRATLLEAEELALETGSETFRRKAGSRERGADVQRRLPLELGDLRLASRGFSRRSENTREGAGESAHHGYERRRGAVLRRGEGAGVG